MEHSETTPGTDERIRDRHPPLQYHCTQAAGTEQAFTGEYWDEKRAGTYRCVVCGEALFDSDTKYDSGSGWPSFWEPLTEGLVANHQDTSHGMVRTEATCASCGAHLGHVFPAGPQPTGARYCMHSACLTLDPRAA